MISILMPPKLLFQAENAQLDLPNPLFPVRDQKLPRIRGLKFLRDLGAMLANHPPVPLNLLP
jgi:hypothetical protein